MRTGKEYASSLNDGRDVWIVGEGHVPDVTAHNLTKNMVQEYSTWSDRHYPVSYTHLTLPTNREV